jgi:cysteinyl-tRNA synthetase
VPAAVQALVDQRQSARTAKDWNRADAVREQLKGMGWQVRDTETGPVVERAPGP